MQESHGPVHPWLRFTSCAAAHYSLDTDHPWTPNTRWPMSCTIKEQNKTIVRSTIAFISRFSMALMQDNRPYMEHSGSKWKHTIRQTAIETGCHQPWPKLAGSPHRVVPCPPAASYRSTKTGGSSPTLTTSTNGGHNTRSTHHQFCENTASKVWTTELPETQRPKRSTRSLNPKPSKTWDVPPSFPKVTKDRVSLSGIRCCRVRYIHFLCRASLFLWRI